MTLEIVTGKQSTDNYPYGSMRSTMYFSIEFAPKRGYRFVTQSINPKTKALNKPKKSTYHHFMVMTKDENGHFDYKCFNFHGFDDIKKFSDFLTANDVTLTDEQNQLLWAMILGCIKGNCQWMRLGEGVTTLTLLETAKVKEMIALYGKHAPIKELTTIDFNPEAIEALKHPTKTVYDK